MKIIDRYIRHHIFLSTFFVSMVLICVQTFLSLVEEIKMIGTGNYSAMDALLHVLMILPDQFYQLFPMAGFLGCLIGLGKMATQSELIVIRANGASIARIGFCVLKAAIPMVIIMTAIGEWVGPYLENQALISRANALKLNQSAHALWVKKGNQFTRIEQVSSDRLTGVIQYNFGDQNQLRSALFAKKGVLHHQQWQFKGVNKTLFLPTKTVISHHAHSFNLQVKPVEMALDESPAMFSLKELQRDIHYRESMGLNSKPLIYNFWQRVLQPFSTLIMICLGVPFVFGSFRHSSMATHVIVGIVIGFIFYMLNQLFGPITLIYDYPPMMAAITPLCLFFIAMVFAFKIAE